MEPEKTLISACILYLLVCHWWQYYQLKAVMRALVGILEILERKGE